MQVSDIKVVIRLAKVRAEQGSYSNEEYAANNASIEAVEIWLREVGALPPETHAVAAARKYPTRNTTLYGSGPTRIAAATVRSVTPPRKRKKA